VDFKFWFDSFKELTVITSETELTVNPLTIKNTKFFIMSSAKCWSEARPHQRTGITWLRDDDI
jgi:hypothetical protein